MISIVIPQVPVGGLFPGPTLDTKIRVLSIKMALDNAYNQLSASDSQGWVENTIFNPHFVDLQMLNVGISRANYTYIEEYSYIIGLMQLKPILFKGHLYLFLIQHDLLPSSYKSPPLDFEGHLLCRLGGVDFVSHLPTVMVISPGNSTSHI